jgi:LPS-assembly protein
MPHSHRIVEVTRPFPNRYRNASGAGARVRFPTLSPLSSGVRLACGAIASLLLLPALVHAQPAALDAAGIDWVSLDDLTPEQRATLDPACCGAYSEPELPAVEGAADSVALAYDRLEASKEGVATLDGNVEILQQGLLITGDHAVYDRNALTANVEGNVRLRQRGLLLTGTSAAVDQDAGTSEIRDASYVLHEIAARGTANVIVYTDNNGIVTIDNGVFTRCEPGDNAWQIEGSTIELDRPAGRGTARNVTLRVKDVPVLYLPWVSFPINDQRMSGFLAPVVGSTRDGGFDLATPYYFNLAPNYDATFTPRLQTDRGLMLGLELRHRGFNTQQLLDMQYLPSDNQYDAALANVPASDSPPVVDRWLLNYDFQGVLGRGWTALADYQAVSDNDYFQDFGGYDSGYGNGLSSTTRSYLHRTARVDYRDSVWAFTAATEDFQIIDPSVMPISAPYRTLPRVNLDANWFSTAGLEYGFDSEFVVFDRNLNRNRFTATDIANGALVTGSRLAVTPQISLPLSNAGAFLTPALKYKYASWNLDDQARGKDANPSRGVVVGSVDSGLVFERAVTLRDTTYQQTLEPRAYYLYSEYEDQGDIPLFDTSDLTFGFNQLFRDDRFSGRDRVGDTSQLTVAMTSRLYDARGREQVRASLGQIRYFRDRRVTLFNAPGVAELRSGSAVAGEFSYRLSDNWRFGTYVEWDTRDNEFDVENYQFQYQSDVDRIINFGYRYRDGVYDNRAFPGTPGLDRTINQTDISGIWPLNESWSVLGRWNYDHANKRNLETIAGVEYDNCCWTVRVLARKWIDNDALYYGGIEDDNTGVFVQFELKGLGSLLGGNVAGILNNGITGYRERDYVP